MQLLCARAAGQKPWLPVGPEWAGSGAQEPGARRQTSVFFVCVCLGARPRLPASSERAAQGMRAAAEAAVPGEPERR